MKVKHFLKEGAAAPAEADGLEVGKAADLVVLDCVSPEQAVAELAAPLHAFKRGRLSFTREPAVLHRPSGA